VLLVAVEVRPSPIHGLGCFAAEKIIAGQVVWCYLPGFDQAYDLHVIDSLPAQAQRHIGIYGSRRNRPLRRRSEIYESFGQS
jgi:hypothetical protein